MSNYKTIACPQSSPRGLIKNPYGIPEDEEREITQTLYPVPKAERDALLNVAETYIQTLVKITDKGITRDLKNAKVILLGGTLPTKDKVAIMQGLEKYIVACMRRLNVDRKAENKKEVTLPGLAVKDGALILTETPKKEAEIKSHIAKNKFFAELLATVALNVGPILLGVVLERAFGSVPTIDTFQVFKKIPTGNSGANAMGNWTEVGIEAIPKEVTPSYWKAGRIFNDETIYQSFIAPNFYALVLALAGLAGVAGKVIIHRLNEGYKILAPRSPIEEGRLFNPHQTPLKSCLPFPTTMQNDAMTPGVNVWDANSLSREKRKPAPYEATLSTQAGQNPQTGNQFTPTINALMLSPELLAGLNDTNTIKTQVTSPQNLLPYNSDETKKETHEFLKFKLEDIQKRFQINTSLTDDQITELATKLTPKNFFSSEFNRLLGGSLEGVIIWNSHLEALIKKAILLQDLGKISFNDALKNTLIYLTTNFEFTRIAQTVLDAFEKKCPQLTDWPTLKPEAYIPNPDHRPVLIPSGQYATYQSQRTELLDSQEKWVRKNGSKVELPRSLEEVLDHPEKYSGKSKSKGQEYSWDLLSNTPSFAFNNSPVQIVGHQFEYARQMDEVDLFLHQKKKASDPRDVDPLVILKVGENGCGKTTSSREVQKQLIKSAQGEELNQERPDIVREHKDGHAKIVSDASKVEKALETMKIALLILIQNGASIAILMVFIYLITELSGYEKELKDSYDPDAFLGEPLRSTAFESCRAQIAARQAENQSETCYVYDDQVDPRPDGFVSTAINAVFILYQAGIIGLNVLVTTLFSYTNLVPRRERLRPGAPDYSIIKDLKGDISDSQKERLTDDKKKPPYMEKGATTTANDDLEELVGSVAFLETADLMTPERASQINNAIAMRKLPATVIATTSNFPENVPKALLETLSYYEETPSIVQASAKERYSSLATFIRANNAEPNIWWTSAAMAAAADISSSKNGTYMSRDLIKDLVDKSERRAENRRGDKSREDVTHIDVIAIFNEKLQKLNSENADHEAHRPYVLSNLEKIHDKKLNSYKDIFPNITLTDAQINNSTSQVSTSMV